MNRLGVVRSFIRTGDKSRVSGSDWHHLELHGIASRESGEWELVMEPEDIHYDPDYAGEAEPTPEPRRVVQITGLTNNGLGLIVALCFDGTLWQYGNDCEWSQIEGPPPA